MDKKRCETCKEEKPFDEFPRRTDKGITRYRPDCKSCRSKKGKLFRIENPDYYKLLNRSWYARNKDYKNNRIKSLRNDPEYRLNVKLTRMERVYGLPREEYFEMLRASQNKCYICGIELNEELLCVDHNHDTDEVRGLLCRDCNFGLGNFKENIKSLYKAIEYLLKYNKKIIKNYGFNLGSQ